MMFHCLELESQRVGEKQFLSLRRVEMKAVSSTLRTVPDRAGPDRVQSPWPELGRRRLAASLTGPSSKALQKAESAHKLAWETLKGLQKQQLLETKGDIGTGEQSFNF